MINNGEFVVKSLSEIAKKHRTIAVRIETRWGTSAGHDLFLELLNTETVRQGFDQDVYMLLVFLYGVHRDQYGDYNKPLTLDNMNLNLLSLATDYSLLSRIWGEK